MSWNLWPAFQPFLTVSECEPRAQEADPSELDHLHETVRPLVLLLRGLLSHEAALH